MLFYVVFLFGFTTNIVYAWDSTYTALIAFFVGQQIFKATWLLWVAYLLPNIAGVLTWNTLLAYMAAGLWIGSIHVPYPSQLALIAPAICLDLFGQVFVVVFMRVNVSGALDRFRQKYLDFYPALNIEHRVVCTFLSDLCKKPQNSLCSLSLFPDYPGNCDVDPSRVCHASYPFFLGCLRSQNSTDTNFRNERMLLSLWSSDTPY